MRDGEVRSDDGEVSGREGGRKQVERIGQFYLLWKYPSDIYVMV